VRICLVYDCLFPHTVGGAERWYRALAERLASEGHDVTYLTLRQWDRGVDPGVPGVRVVAAGPRMELYTGGRRRILPPLVFGAGVLGHLLRHGRAYDVVHTSSFPYFSLLAAALVRPFGRYRLFVDWVEVWSRAYWREYLGRAGVIGWWVQRVCVRVRQRAFSLSQLHAARLRELGIRGEVSVLRGLRDGSADPEPIAQREPLVVFAGRHIPEKRVPALVPAFKRALEERPQLRMTIFGDGPDFAEVRRLIDEHGLADTVSLPGFVDPASVDDALRRASTLVLPSRREGYGLVVVEAAAAGTPSVVVDDPDNAAVELIEPGVNGVLAESAEPAALGGAIVAAVDGGEALRASTAAWYREHAGELSLESSLRAVAAAYAS
jgi:glycosyltransferase involved in cell wall biosynthesis